MSAKFTQAGGEPRFLGPLFRTPDLLGNAEGTCEDPLKLCTWLVSSPQILALHDYVLSASSWNTCVSPRPNVVLFFNLFCTKGSFTKEKHQLLVWLCELALGLWCIHIFFKQSLAWPFTLAQYEVHMFSFIQMFWFFFLTFFVQKGFSQKNNSHLNFIRPCMLA